MEGLQPPPTRIIVDTSTLRMKIHNNLPIIIEVLICRAV